MRHTPAAPKNERDLFLPPTPSQDGDKAELARLKLQVARLEREARRLRGVKDDMQSKLVKAILDRGQGGRLGGG